MTQYDIHFVSSTNVSLCYVTALYNVTFHQATYPQYNKSSPPRQNGRHFPDDIFRSIFMMGVFCFDKKNLPKFVPKGPINNNPVLAQIMPSHYLNQFWPNSLTQICGTRDKVICVTCNLLWARDAIYPQRTWSTLVQKMARCLTASSHYLNQCWIIVSKVHCLWNRRANPPQVSNHTFRPMMQIIETLPVLNHVAFINYSGTCAHVFEWSPLNPKVYAHVLRRIIHEDIPEPPQTLLGSQKNNIPSKNSNPRMIHMITIIIYSNW